MCQITNPIVPFLLRKFRWGFLLLLLFAKVKLTPSPRPKTGVRQLHSECMKNVWKGLQGVRKVCRVCLKVSVRSDKCILMVSGRHL